VGYSCRGNYWSIDPESFAFWMKLVVWSCAQRQEMDRSWWSLNRSLIVFILDWESKFLPLLILRLLGNNHSSLSIITPPPSLSCYHSKSIMNTSGLAIVFKGVNTIIGNLHDVRMDNWIVGVMFFQRLLATPSFPSIKPKSPPQCQGFLESQSCQSTWFL